MTIGFTIPASESYVSVDTAITPDKGMSRKGSSRLRIAKFGDGYEQRIVDGINNVEEQYSVEKVHLLILLLLIVTQEAGKPQLR